MDTENQAPEPDEYEVRREEAKAALIACQEAKNLQSCSSCEKLLACEVRNAYVDAVFFSMNKGQAGGFEF